jgi:putative oxidoreductase
VSISGYLVTVEPVDLGLLVLRVVVGLTVALHGLNKFRSGLGNVGRWFESMGMHPGKTHATLAACTEMGAGILLALGLLTPFAAGGIIGVMTVAGITAHMRNGFFIFRPGEGYEYVMVLAVAAFAIATIGPGTASLDNAIGLDFDWWGAVISGVVGLGAAAVLLAVFWRPPARAQTAAS